MSDVSKKPRVFIVNVNCQHAGSEGHTEEVEVPAGEDAGDVCLDVIDTLIGNHFITSWEEKKSG